MDADENNACTYLQAHAYIYPGFLIGDSASVFVLLSWRLLTRAASLGGTEHSDRPDGVRDSQANPDRPPGPSTRAS